MNSRERVLIALKRQGKPDRVPFEISWGAFTPALMDRYRKETGSNLSPEEYFDFDTRWIIVNPTKLNKDYARYFNCKLPDDVTFNEWGIGTVPGSMEHFVEIKFHPLQIVESVEEVINFDWPDIEADYRYEGLGEQIENYKSRGYAVFGDMYATIFETAWQLRGMEEMLVDFYINEDIAHAICDKLGALRVKQAQMYAKLGVDVIRLGDDIATQKGHMFSPEIYRKFIKEPTREIKSPEIYQ